MEYVKDLVSVIVPCYNYEAFIRETLNSVVNQTYTKLEIVVCDNGSTDKTAEIIKEYAEKDPRIKPLFIPENRGMSYNYNQCYDYCMGEYVALLCGDDLMLPTKIEKQVNFLKNNPEYVVCIHEVEVFDSFTGEVIMIMASDSIIESPEEWFFNTNWTFKNKKTTYPPSSNLGRSSYILSSRYDYRLPYKNEVLFAIDHFHKFPGAKWHTIPEILGKYRKHGNNTSTSFDMNSKLLEETNLLFAIVISKYPEYTKKIAKVRDFFYFRSLLFSEIPSETRSQYFNSFCRNATFFVILYYLICRILFKTKMFWPFMKVLNLFK